MKSTEALVLSCLSGEPKTAYQIADQIHYSHQTVTVYLRRALKNGRVVRCSLPSGQRWVYGWRLRCRDCGR